MQKESIASSEDVQQVETTDSKDKADEDKSETVTETGAPTTGVEEAVDANDDSSTDTQDGVATPSGVNDDGTPADVQETQTEASVADPAEAIPNGKDESSQKQAATQTQASATAQAEPISLQVEGVGRLTVAPDQEVSG